MHEIVKGTLGVAKIEKGEAEGHVRQKKDRSDGFEQDDIRTC